MSVNYQPDRHFFNPYNQDLNRDFNTEEQEYKDLYNPHKSIWNSALEKKKFHGSAPRSMSFKSNEIGRNEYQNVPGYAPANTRGVSFHRLHPRDAAYPTYNSDELHGTGDDLTRRNTYRNRTTGYGPRD